MSVKRNIFIILFIFLITISVKAENNIKKIFEGYVDAPIKILAFESLTCPACANFHKNIYPELKKDFIDTGLIKIEFINFPLDIMALNAAKIVHCKNDGDSKIIHFLYKNQTLWAKENTVEKANSNLKKLLSNNGYSLNFDECINNKEIENHILEDRIEGTKKYKVNATPTLIINEKKFDKSLTYKNLKKIIEKNL